MAKMRCKTCDIEFVFKPSKRDGRNYCNRDCYLVWRREFYKPSLACKKKISKSLLGNKRRVGHKPWMTGKVNIWVLEDKNFNWKGNKVGYRALHRWVNKRKLGGAVCEFCSKVKTTPKSIHLANKTGKYLRDLDDWFYLCVKCHKRYDSKK